MIRNLTPVQRILAFLGIGVLLGALLQLGGVTAEAKADPCVGSWSIGIGGQGDNLSMGFWGLVNQPVGYNSWDPITGLWEVDKLFWQHRNACPGDHIELIGHSQGAAIVHQWVSEHQWVDNANAVLLADSKRWYPGLGGPGLSYHAGLLGYPVAGVDDWVNYGPFPVVSVCRWRDWVCNLDAPWFESHINQSHGAYDFNPHHYDDWGHGPVMI